MELGSSGRILTNIYIYIVMYLPFIVYKLYFRPSITQYISSKIYFIFCFTKYALLSINWAFIYLNEFLNIFGISVSKIKFHYNLTITTANSRECLCILWLYLHKLFLKFEFLEHVLEMTKTYNLNLLTSFWNLCAWWDNWNNMAELEAGQQYQYDMALEH